MAAAAPDAPGGLAALVRPDAVLLRPTAPDAEQLIRALAMPLVRAGDARPSMPAAAIEREREHPTGLLLSPDGPNAAIPHADREHVVRSAVAIAVLDDPVGFHRMDAPAERIPVRLVILLALADADSQLAALREVGAILQDPDRVAGILAARDTSGVLAALRGAAE
ncbi:MAG: PTS sugar transporter subunit IIA [Schumannella sp.]|nr:PTS sugar transporter subunit IIA [Microbacteriaceae bacterium]